MAAAEYIHLEPRAEKPTKSSKDNSCREREVKIRNGWYEPVTTKEHQHSTNDVKKFGPSTRKMRLEY